MFNTEYGNFHLVDETGDVLVYGLTAEKQSSNDKSFSTLGLKEGDTVVIEGTVMNSKARRRSVARPTISAMNRDRAAAMSLASILLLPTSGPWLLPITRLL